MKTNDLKVGDMLIISKDACCRIHIGLVVSVNEIQFSYVDLTSGKSYNFLLHSEMTICQVVREGELIFTGSQFPLD